MNRIYVYVGLAFVASFAGVSWAARGFPIGIGSSQVVLTTGNQDQATKRENERIMRSLDTIKNDALQAATGFALSPCDSTMNPTHMFRISGPLMCMKYSRISPPDLSRSCFVRL